MNSKNQHKYCLVTLCFELPGGEAEACESLDRAAYVVFALCWQYGVILGSKIPPGKLRDAHYARLWFPGSQMFLNVTQATLLSIYGAIT